MSYLEMKRKHQEEINNFPLFAAFNDAQFESGMKKMGLKPNDKCSVMSLGCGVFIRKVDTDAYMGMLLRHCKELEEAIAADITGEAFIREMFGYELSNHEYVCTRDLTDTFEALNLTVEQVNASRPLRHGLYLAIHDAV